MYLEHYGLSEPPFSITPDPRFVFLSERHRDALAHLLFGVTQGGGGGFVQLTGEVGTGKTTLCRLLLEQLAQMQDRTPTRVALVLNPRLTPVELLETICEELRVDLDQGNRRGSLKALVDALNAYLLDAYAQGLRVVLVIDEAQNLSTEALEQVRLLTNLETPTQKLLQILLLGQPELREMLARDDMRQLAQRITARFHLTPLDADETAQYLRHRWRVAGGQRFPFTTAATRRIHRHAGGVPRLINVIAERSLLAGYAHDADPLDAHWVDRAAREALPQRRPYLSLRRIAVGAVAVLALVALTVTAWTWTHQTPSAPLPSAVASPAPPPKATASGMSLDAAGFALALRSPPLQPGATGALVTWVRAQLQPRYLSSASSPAVFDADMQDAVRRFQRDRGLADDGVVGQATLIALASGDHARPAPAGKE